MPKFQGSGFALQIPGDCIDASAYTFVLPENGGFSPNLTIRFERVEGAPDLNEYVEGQMSTLSNNVEDFTLISKASGKRGQWDGVMSVCEWGQGAMRMQQKQVYLLVEGKPSRIYIATTTDLASQAKQSSPIFDQMLRSFSPNDIQVL